MDIRIYVTILLVGLISMIPINLYCNDTVVFCYGSILLIIGLLGYCQMIVDLTRRL